MVSILSFVVDLLLFAALLPAIVLLLFVDGLPSSQILLLGLVVTFMSLGILFSILKSSGLVK